MRKIMMELIIALSLESAFGAAMVRTELPLSPFVDTEISTNLAFAAYEPRQRQFAYELAFDATPSNNFEVAFGRDVDANGILSRDEADFSVGWDCGEWFSRRTFSSTDGENVAMTNRVECDSSPEGTRRLRLVFETGRLGHVRSVSAKVVRPGATNDLFAAAGSVPHPWPYDPAWNLLRLTARGFDEPTASFSFKTTLDGNTITLR